MPQRGKGEEKDHFHGNQFYLVNGKNQETYFVG
jgi:hypothetical protein